MNEDLRFSIVIPTRERANTLKYCLQTCVEQELFDNYEIIVSDNNSSPSTKEVVDSFNNTKIKYYSTGRTLPMYENFEFAISKATGEYVIVLGDDDGMILKALYHIDRIITKTKLKAIVWQWITYYWPVGVPLGYENIMDIPTSTDVRIFKGKDSLKSVIRFKTAYHRLPMLYINSAIHRDLINELKLKTGRVFNGLSPDCYSAICMGYLTEYFLFLDRPITIVGTSAKSNGYNHFYKKSDNVINSEFDKLNNSSSVGFHKTIPNLKSINAVVSDVFMQAKDRLFTNDEDLILDRKLMISKILEDLFVFDKEEWNNSLDIIKSTLNDDIGLLKWFEEIILNYEPRFKDFSVREIISTGLYPSKIVIDTVNFGCENVYDVAKLYNKSLESEIYIPDNLQWDVNKRDEHRKLTSTLRKVYKRIRHAGRIIIKGS